MYLVSGRRRSHDRVVGRGGPAALTDDYAGLSHRPPAGQQSDAVPGRSARRDEIVAVMRHTPSDRHGYRPRAIIVVLWRAGCALQDALALAEHDLDPRHGSLLVRRGKGGR